MSDVINLWNPTHVTFLAALATAFLLGLIHGVTPDEHTWPITFSYAVGGYSSKRGLRAGVVFALAFTMQRALASELACLGFKRWMDYGHLEYLIDIAVGVAMLAAGLFIAGRRSMPHVRFRFRGRRAEPERALRDPGPWMPAVHGFVAGWGIGAFALIIYTVLAPAMPSAAVGWLPGFLFGLGTLLVQGVAGAAVGAWLARRGLSPDAVRRIGLTTASRTLSWGGCAFVFYGIVGTAFPRIAGITVTTPIHVHNLHSLGLSFLLLLFVVVGVGMTSLFTLTHAAAARNPPKRVGQPP